MDSALFSTLIKALTATKDPVAVQSAFNVVKNIAKPTLVDFVRSAELTKNPKAVKAVFNVFKVNKAEWGPVRTAIELMSTGALHALTPVVLPKEALQKF